MKDDPDLTAWTAPPPKTSPGALADAVIARLRSAAPVEVDPPRRRARWFVLGGTLAAAAAAAALLVWGVDRAPRDGHGEISGNDAHHLDLGATVVDVDPGADLHWQRRGDRVDATLDKGAAQWTVGAADSLTVAAPIAQAQITATNARLRVEVPMLNPYAKIIGTSALTAVASSLLTVTVYEGRARVDRAGDTFFVTPGAPFTVPVAPPKPPVDVTYVGASVPRSSSDEAVITFDDPSTGYIAAAPMLTPMRDSLGAYTDARDIPGITRFELMRGMFGSYLLGTCLQSVNHTLYIQAGVAPDGHVTTATITETVGGADVRQPCLEAAATHAHFPVTKHGGSFVTSWSGGDCESAEDATKHAESQYSAGFAGQALQTLEASLTCHPAKDEARGKLLRMAALYSCRSHSPIKAKSYYPQLDARFQAQIAQACLQEGIELK
ncbi:MAG TPA: hypothetical protein VGM88_33250 [Kofleriaceae bacterium]|jgi:hypothetical protein